MDRRGPGSCFQVAPGLAVAQAQKVQDWRWGRIRAYGRAQDATVPVGQNELAHFVPQDPWVVEEGV
eukprot:5263464-Alexandrium_andersonii.AAC.1